jgi:hypothetical protein
MLARICAGLAFSDAVFEATDGSEGVEGDRVTLDQGVEEMPERGERLIPGRSRAGELTEVFAGLPSTSRWKRSRSLSESSSSWHAPGVPRFCERGNLRRGSGEWRKNRPGCWSKLDLNQRDPSVGPLQYV